MIFEHIAPMGGDGGFIAIDSEGRISMPFNTEGMYRAFLTVDGQVNIEIYKD
ncbi:MAG: isoaspartyl peptidase/L-asparaginase [Cryomorphaceae bacterium]